MAITLDGTNGILSPDFEPSSSTTPTNGLFLPAANALGFATNSTERLRLDASGNLGLGVTPSAWGTLTAMQCKNAHFGGYVNNGYFGANCYYTGSAWNYIGTGTAHRMELGNGQFQWFTAPSGTAGNAISFTQAMTLDSSGNLLVGTTTASGYKATISRTGGGGVQIVTTASTASNPSIDLFDGGVDAVLSAAGGEGVFWVGTYSNHPMGFRTNNTERARIDSSGNFLVGTTSSAGSYLFQISGNFSGSYGQLVKSSASSGYMISFNTSSGQAGYISSSGTSTSYVASSDQRLKENIVDAPSALGSINAIKVRSFDWKSDGSHVDYGYIAQELLAVAPEAVSVHEDPEQMMGVDFGKLTPRLVKAIQELTARLEALEAK